MASAAAPEGTSGSRGMLLAGGSLLVATVAFLASFRQPFPALEASLGADVGRMLAAASVGAAVAVSGALRIDSRPLREAYLFALSVGGAIGIAAGLKWIGGTPAAIGLAGVGAIAALGLVRLADGRRRIANFGLFLVLFTLLVAATPAYMTAGTEIQGFGGAAIWLLGDVSRAHGIGAVGVAIATLALVAAAARGPLRWNSAISAVLLGLSVGVAGPIAFVGTLVPKLVRSVAPGGPTSRCVVLSALVGAVAVILADTVPRLLIGGYAPPLNVAIAQVAIPCFLWWNGRRLRAAVGVDASRVFTAIGVISILVLALGGVLLFAALTTFIRSST